MPQRIGVMGGTFDPVHLGHLRIAEEAVEELELDEVIFIPAALPPHKPGMSILPFAHRWNMLQLALAGHPRFLPSDLENRLPGKSYTVITLRRLHEERGEDAEFFFFVGLDAFLELNTWWHFQELFRLAHIVVLRRPGYVLDDVGDFLHRKVSPLFIDEPDSRLFRHPELLTVHYLRNSCLAISSTDIRRLVARGRSIRYLVLPEIMRYIHENELYRTEYSQF